MPGTYLIPGTRDSKVWVFSVLEVTKLPHQIGVLQIIKSTSVYNRLCAGTGLGYRGPRSRSWDGPSTAVPGKSTAVPKKKVPGGTFPVLLVHSLAHVCRATMSIKRLCLYRDYVYIATMSIVWQ